jgi:hypothetical protein
MPDENVFRQLATMRGLSAGRRPGNDADALEALDLIDAIEEGGDRVLRLVQDCRIGLEDGQELVERLMQCYSRPLQNAREIAQLRIEIKRLGQ